jgi:hypothetical protein
MRQITLTIALILTTVLPVGAQSRWKQIGKTSNGSLVYVDPKTVKTANGITNARLRIKFDPPVKTAKGTWVTSQVQAMFDCKSSKIAAKENVFYADERGETVVEHTVNKIPGYGPALEGSMGKIALDYFCKK